MDSRGSSCLRTPVVAELCGSGGRRVQAFVRGNEHDLHRREASSSSRALSSSPGNDALRCPCSRDVRDGRSRRRGSPRRMPPGEHHGPLWGSGRGSTLARRLREVPEKDHGTQNLIEKPPPSQDAHVVLLEDVTTTGESAARAVYDLVADGFTVLGVVTVVDRRENRSPHFERGIRSMPSSSSRN